MSPLSFVVEVTGLRRGRGRFLYLIIQCSLGLHTSLFRLNSSTGNSPSLATTSIRVFGGIIPRSIILNSIQLTLNRIQALYCLTLFKGLTFPNHPTTTNTPFCLQICSPPWRPYPYSFFQMFPSLTLINQSFEQFSEGFCHERRGNRGENTES